MPNYDFLEGMHETSETPSVQELHKKRLDALQQEFDYVQSFSVRPALMDQTVPTDVETLVTSDILHRQTLGVAKYGTTVANNPLPLREWLNHAYEECLDQAVYLKRSIQEIDRESARSQTND